MSKCFVTDYHHLAYTLDPRYKGERIICDEVIFHRILTLLKDYGQKCGIIINDNDIIDVKTSFSMYLNKESIFGCDMLNDLCPNNYWKEFKGFKRHHKLALIAERLLSIPSSSASVERSFSFQSLMHTYKRNNLSNEKIQKLMQIQWALRKSIPKEEEEYSFIPEEFIPLNNPFGDIEMCDYGYVPLSLNQ
jgi:hypothetical protein